ncbi:T9SS type A sorting domain-containing protein [Flavobacterium macrobrachii]|jgi:hypothetical protein|uniref:T9SS type A sorting domain-containing protein n=1 Tax=Flavobacterium macrobrachii TaxID=591204 RepID=UPI0037BE5C06
MKKILLSIAIAFSLNSNAQNIFRDDFSTYNTGVQLSGQGSWTNNSSNGGSGPCTGAICSNAKVVQQNIGYTGYGSSSKAFSLTPDTDGCGRLFGTTVTSGDLYVGMVINITNAQTSPQDFFRVQNGSFITTTFRVLVQPTSGSTYSIGIRKGDLANPTVYTSNSYNYGTDYLLIFKYTQGAGVNDDTVSLYANPNYLAGESGNNVSATNFAGNDQAGGIDRLVFRQNVGPAGMPTGKVGLVSVARTWEELTFTLSNNEFTKNSFIITSNQANYGKLNIKSSIASEKVRLSIYNIEGKNIETKLISLNENNNDITINPIQNKGIYIVEISSENNRFTQKIIVN